MLSLTTPTITPSHTGAAGGSELARTKVARANYPLLVIGAVLLLIILFFLVAKLRRDD